MGEIANNTGYIYTIKCKDDEKLIYVGSTINLKRRWNEHKQAATQSKFKHYYLYNKMSELGHDRFYIEVYETIIFNFRSELFKRENEIIKLLGTLNNYILTDFTRIKTKEELKLIKRTDEENKQKEIINKKEEKQNEINESLIKLINEKFNKTSNEKDRIQTTLLLNLYNGNNDNKIDFKKLKILMLNNDYIYKRYNDANYYLNLKLK